MTTKYVFLENKMFRKGRFEFLHYERIRKNQVKFNSNCLQNIIQEKEFIFSKNCKLSNKDRCCPE
jgi:hypothetical protein